MSALIRDTELADQWQIDVARLHRLRREKGLPCVKFSRTDVRFTPDMVEQIVELLTVIPGTRGQGKQTSRSAARGRS